MPQEVFLIFFQNKNSLMLSLPLQSEFHPSTRRPMLSPQSCTQRHQCICVLLVSYITLRSQRNDPRHDRQPSPRAPCMVSEPPPPSGPSKFQDVLPAGLHDSVLQPRSNHPAFAESVL